MTVKQKVAVVAGMGPGNGAALARRFAAAGYAVAMLARSRASIEPLEREIDGARGFECDVGVPESVAESFGAVRVAFGPVDVLLYNAGSGVFADVAHITPADFESAWRVNAYGALLCAHEVIPDMKAAGGGAIVFIGVGGDVKPRDFGVERRIGHERQRGRRQVRCRQGAIVGVRLRTACRRSECLPAAAGRTARAGGHG